MKIILHGEDIVNSRNALYSLRKKYPGEIINLSGKTASLTEVKQILESSSLFTSKRLLIIENLYSRPSKKETLQLIDYLSNTKTNTDIILWENKEISPVNLKKISSKWEIKLYSLPKLLFTFLENITPFNHQNMLKLFQEVRKTNSDEFIYLMIVRQIRLLLLAKEKSLSGIKPWLISKLTKQANKFTLTKLLEIYKKLLVIDIETKTGNPPFELNQRLDLWLTDV